MLLWQLPTDFFCSENKSGLSHTKQAFQYMPSAPIALTKCSLNPLLTTKMIIMNTQSIRHTPNLEQRKADNIQKRESVKEIITRLFWYESEDIKPIAARLSVPVKFVRRVVADFMNS